MEGPNWTLSDDLKRVTLSLSTTPPVELVLPVTEVESILENLGEFRAHMTPEVPKNWTPGQLVGAIPDPHWYTEHEAMEGNSLLHIRDPRFGWLSYIIPREEARRLGELLVSQANSPAPQAGQA